MEEYSEIEINRCEWCGMKYPAEGLTYLEVKVFGVNHIICKDCYEHLKRVSK